MTAEHAARGINDPCTSDRQQLRTLLRVIRVRNIPVLGVDVQGGWEAWSEAAVRDWRLWSVVLTSPGPMDGCWQPL